MSAAEAPLRDRESRPWTKRGVSRVFAPAYLAFVFLALAASPAHYWLDSGEIASAGALLGVMHPTGVVGYVPLLHLASALPLGSLGLRMALVSSLCMAGAIAALLGLLHRRDAHWALCAVVGLWIPLGLTAARNGRVVEIYAFAALLLALTLWGMDPGVPEDKRNSRRCIGVFAAVLATWGFGDLRLALVPPVVLAWLIAWVRAEPWSRWAPLSVALASTSVLTLPLSSARDTLADWGNPESWPGVWDHVMASLIRESFATQLAGMGAEAYALHLRLLTLRLVEDLGPLGLLLAIAALCFALTRPISAAARARKASEEAGREASARARDFVDADHRLLRWVAWIVAVELIYIVAVNPMGGRDRQTGLALCLLAALTLGLELHRMTHERPPLRWVGLPLLAAALWLPAGLESFADAKLTRSWAPHDWTREALAQLPSDALVLGQTDDFNAGLAAARALEGARPDVVSLVAQQLYRAPNDWQVASERRALPWRAVAANAGPNSSERERVGFALQAWQGAVALESPMSGALAGIMIPGEGVPPLWLGERPPPPDALPPGVRGAGDPLAEAVARWSPRLEHPLDRRRLADALVLRIQGDFALAPESPLRWLEAERGYRMVLDEVYPNHAQSLIGLGAVRDRFGETAEAVELTKKALEIDPERPTALSNLAFYLARAEQTLPEAREYAELAVQLAANKRSAWSRLLLVCRAQADTVCAARAQARLD